MTETRTVIVGTKHKGPAALRHLGTLAKGDPVEFRLEPENENDPGAVAVYAGEQPVGFVPKHSNGDIRRALQQGIEVRGEITLAAIMDGEQTARGGLPHIVARWGDEPDGFPPPCGECGRRADEGHAPNCSHRAWR